MKVLTLHQPWASLVALGVKSIETRSWSTKHRGPLAIHAGGKKPRNVWAQDTPDVYNPIVMGRYLEIFEDVHGTGSFLYEWRGPLGAIVATCTLEDVVPILTPADVIERRAMQAVSVLGDSLLLCERFGAGPIVDIKDQRPYGLFESGRFAWLLADVVPVDPPVPFKGGQGLTKTWTPAEVPA